jgi:hypothetical protein
VGVVLAPGLALLGKAAARDPSRHGGCGGGGGYQLSSLPRKGLVGLRTWESSTTNRLFTFPFYATTFINLFIFRYPFYYLLIVLGVDD